MTGIIDHTMIRVTELEETLDWYQRNFGWVEKGRWEADTFTNVYIGPADVNPEVGVLEITYNNDGRNYNLGDAWGHLALRVEDLYDAYEQLMKKGVENYRNPESCGGSYAFIKDPDGYEIELVEREQGVQWSLDHIMLRVEDADAAIGWYVRKLGYNLVRRLEYETYSLYFLKPVDASEQAMAVELTYNYDDQSYNIGDAWGHLAVRTNNLHEEWKSLMTRGAKDYRDPKSCDGRYAFTKDADGHEIKIVIRN